MKHKIRLPGRRNSRAEAEKRDMKQSYHNAIMVEVCRKLHRDGFWRVRYASHDRHGRKVVLMRVERAGKETINALRRDTWH